MARIPAGTGGGSGDENTDETNREGSDRAAADETQANDMAASDAAPGVRRAVDQTPEPEPEPDDPPGDLERDRRASDRVSGDAGPPSEAEQDRRASRRVAEAPDPAPPEPDPGAQRAVDRTPETGGSGGEDAGAGGSDFQPETQTGRVFSTVGVSDEDVRRFERETEGALEGVATSPAPAVGRNPVGLGSRAVAAGGTLLAGGAVVDAGRRTEVGVGEDIFGAASEIQTPMDGAAGRGSEIAVPATGGATGRDQGELPATPPVRDQPEIPTPQEQQETFARTDAIVDQPSQPGNLPTPGEDLGPTLPTPGETAEESGTDFESERTFPTGESAVVGRGVSEEATNREVTAEGQQTARENIRDFQRSLGQGRGRTRGDTTVPPLVGPETGTGTQGEAVPVPDVGPGFESPPATETGTPADVATPPETPPGFETPPETAPASAPRGPTRMDLPDFGGGPSRRSSSDEDELFDHEFISPVAAPEDVLSGTAFDRADFDIDSI